MENASKALIIAGGVLVAILIITLLVFFYNNIREMTSIGEKTEEVEKIAEFNKQFDVYDRKNLYGTDILSLANKVVDYNRRENQSKGYQELEMQVKFKDNIFSTNSELNIKENDELSSSKIKKISDSLEKLVKDRGEYTKKGEYIQSISRLSSYRSNELDKFLEDNNISYLKDEIKENIQKYLSDKSALTKLKTKQFKSVKFEYNNLNGRIVKMNFEQV